MQKTGLNYVDGEDSSLLSAGSKSINNPVIYVLQIPESIDSYEKSRIRCHYDKGLAGYTFGKWVLRINPVLLLGAITGSMTSGAALSIVNREAGNSRPTPSYIGAYAFANVLLTVAGSVILLL